MSLLPRLEFLVLRELFAAPKGVSALTFWKEHQISPGALVDCLRDYVKNGLVDFDGIFVTLTHEGFSALASKFPVSSFSADEGAKQSVAHFLAPQLPVNMPIVPVMARVDHEILGPTYSERSVAIQAKRRVV